MPSKGAYGLTPMTEDFLAFDEPENNLDTADEKRTRNLSKTKQWREFVEFARQRQELYRMYLPGANPAVRGSNDDWKVADCIVQEYEALINFVEGKANG